MNNIKNTLTGFIKELGFMAKAKSLISTVGSFIVVVPIILQDPDSVTSNLDVSTGFIALLLVFVFSSIWFAITYAMRQYEKSYLNKRKSDGE